MSSEAGLFDVPDDAYLIPPAPEAMSRGQRRQRLIDGRIATGVHPLGYILLHPDASKERGGDGPTCGDCAYRVTEEHHNRTYPKCHYGNGSRSSRGESSDIRAWWPACTTFEPKGRTS